MKLPAGMAALMLARASPRVPPLSAASPLEQSATLDVSGLHKCFGNRSALNGVDLQLHPGEICALLGPNGAGKTTLLRCACGRIPPDRGTVRVCGGDPHTDPQARANLGLVPQTIAVYTQLTVRENLQVFSGLMGLASVRHDEVIETALQRAGLKERSGDTCATLSGGMQRRLNIVSGLVHSPKLLLLDEPTVGLDPVAREKVHRLLRYLRRQGMSILITTHDLDQAADLADHVGLMLDGSIRAAGTPKELVAQVFGDSKELVINVEGSTTRNGRQLLRSHGLVGSTDGHVWSGPFTHGYEQLPELEAELRSQAIPITELRVREPGLSGVFLHITGRELEE